jgi:predicted transcriptional regulator
MSEETAAPKVPLDLVVKIVSAYAGHHVISPGELTGIIASVHSALAGLGSAPAPVEAEPLTPAVPIKKSIMPEYLVCLEDGKKLKMLKRHLDTAYGMTPDQYRARWKLPPDYPMVAPNYAKQRSALALSIGLGRRAAAPVEPPPPPPPPAKPARKPRAPKQPAG